MTKKNVWFQTKTSLVYIIIRLTKKNSLDKIQDFQIIDQQQ